MALWFGTSNVRVVYLVWLWMGYVIISYLIIIYCLGVICYGGCELVYRWLVFVMCYVICYVCCGGFRCGFVA